MLTSFLMKFVALSKSWLISQKVFQRISILCLNVFTRKFFLFSLTRWPIFSFTIFHQHPRSLQYTCLRQKKRLCRLFPWPSGFDPGLKGSLYSALCPTETPPCEETPDSKSFLLAKASILQWSQMLVNILWNRIIKFVRMSTWLSCVSCDVMSTVCATDGSWRRKGLGGRQIYICFVAIAHNLFNNIKVICLWVLHSEMKGWVSNCIPTKDINKAKINKK